METKKNQLPKATAEIVKEYDELQQKMDGLDPSWSDDEVNAVSARLRELADNYDWFNIEFTDPDTGKMGMKTVAGEVIVPPLYDGFVELRSYVFSPHAPAIAIKEGKCGIVKGDGSGQQLCEFKFDYIRSHPGCSLFVARWGEEKKRFGIITAIGKIICPNILTSLDIPVNGIMTIESDGKCGVIDIETYQCVLPEYDELEMDAEDYITFVKGDQKGYITEEKGEYVPVEQYENDENYFDVSVLATRLY